MTESTILISDIHLGSIACHPKRLTAFLNTLTAKRLIIVGDLGDKGNCCDDAGQMVYTSLRHCALRMDVVLLPGNDPHDPENREVADNLRLQWAPFYEWESGGRRFLAVHGHAHPITGEAWDPWEKSYGVGPWPLTQVLNWAETSLAFWGKGLGLWAARKAHALRKFTTPGTREGCRRGVQAFIVERGANCAFYGHTHLPEGLPLDWWSEPASLALNIGSAAVEPLATYGEEDSGRVRLCELP